MPSNYKTPGIYIEENQNLPFSAVSVQTSIPCFFGKTEKARHYADDDLKKIAFKINSFAEYELYYGYSDSAVANILITLKTPYVASLARAFYNTMYFSIKHYFENGGDSCYIHCVGYYAENLTDEDYKEELAKLDLLDEVSIIVLLDLAGLQNYVKAYDVYNYAMQKAAFLKDKFVIIDVYEQMNGNKIDSSKSKNDFKLCISSNNNETKFAAAYYPFLQSTYNYDFNTATLKMIFTDDFTAANPWTILLNNFDYKLAKTILILYRTLNYFESLSFDSQNTEKYLQKTTEIEDKIKSVVFSFTIAEGIDLYKSAIALINRITTLGIDAENNNYKKFDYTDSAENEKENLIAQLQSKIFSLYNTAEIAANKGTIDSFSELDSKFLSKIEQLFTSEFNKNVLEAFLKIPVILPPSPSIAGIYASVDRLRGVWKAPANIAIESVSQPNILLSDLDIGDFNIDSQTGKSINCILRFPDRGTLVWGARTLAGNDNEWKYINIRRFINMVEKAAKNSLMQFVFEANNANTWLRVKKMLENYLMKLWRHGALQGNKHEHAFYVAIGLNQTMTQQDIGNGLLIVEIGLATIRPAEFTIIRISQIQTAT